MTRRDALAGALAAMEERIAIEALAAEVVRLREALERINDIDVRYCEVCQSKDGADAVRIADNALEAITEGQNDA